jgi:hypothetical protein
MKRPLNITINTSRIHSFTKINMSLNEENNGVSRTVLSTICLVISALEDKRSQYVTLVTNT